MKSFVKAISLILSFVLFAGLLPFSAFAYGTADGKIIVTHINTSGTTEGSAIVLTPACGETIGSKGTFGWWMVATFEWDTTESCYKLTKRLSANGSDKANTQIPTNGFVYAICIGNNYPKLYAETGNSAYANKPNYVQDRIVKSYEYLASLAIGTKVYVYNTDLKNALIDTNGAAWYLDAFTSNSFIKAGTPESTGTPYDPNNTSETLFRYDLGVNYINAYGANTGMSIIFTKTYGADIFGSNASQKYYWWKTATFEWNAADNCYNVTSFSLVLDNNSAKQVVIPENGFVLAVITGTTLTDAASGNMDKLKIGAKAFVYGADLKAGTITSGAKVSINLPDSSLIAYNPALTGSQLDSPVITNMTEKKTLTTNAGFKIQWNPVAGATGYVVNVSNSSYVADGLLTVSNKNVTDTFYQIGSGILEVGNTYTVSVYAYANGSISSLIKRAKLAVVSEESFSSNVRTKKIIAFGDSITVRTGWVGLVGGRFGADIINAGVGGNNSTNAKARFQSDVLSQNPDIVIINFGMNDQAVGTTSKTPCVDVATYRSNLEYFATELQKIGAHVIFVTPNPVCTETGYYVAGGYNLDYGSESMLLFVDAMRKVALKYNCGLVDMHAECGKDDLTKICAVGDGIHPSVYGHQKYASVIGNYLAAVYDNKSLQSVTISYKDSTDKELATRTLKGAEGSTVVIPGIDIDGYNCTSSPVTFTFSATNNAQNFVYSPIAAPVIELNTTSKYKIVEKYLIINQEQLTEQTLLSNIKTTGVICTPKSGSLIGTGSKVQLKNGATVVTELTVVLSGDANGDGKVNGSDYLLIKRHFLNTYTLKDEFLKASDVDSSGTITSIDYLRIKRHFIGSFNLYA